MDSSTIETLLWEIMSNQVEKVDVAKQLLTNINYIEQGKVDQISKCTMLDSDYFEITSINNKENKIYVDFEMPFIIDAWNQEEEHLFHILGCVNGQCAIPDESEFDYAAYDFDSMNKTELLSHASMVELIQMDYSDIEVNG